MSTRGCGGILLLLCWCTLIHGGKQLISIISVEKLINNINNYNILLYDKKYIPEIVLYSHSKWEQHVDLPDGHIVDIEWIFRSRKSLEGRLSSVSCEIVTWVVTVDEKPLGQVTCFWSMSLANHCNQMCQFPLVLSYKYNNYVDFLSVLGTHSATMSTFVIYDNNGNLSRNISSLKSYVSPYSMRSMDIDPGESIESRQLRTYSDSEEWISLSSNKLTSITGVANENFGTSVSVSGDYAAVSAIGTKDFEGRVYMYQRLGVTLWKQEYFALLGDEEYSNDFFGWSISLSDDTVAVGAYQTMHVEENKQTSVGAVYIYLRVSSLHFIAIHYH